LTIGEDDVRLRITARAKDGSVLARVARGGMVGTNKGVAADQDVPLPSFSQKDRRAICSARQQGILHYALSFARGEEPVRQLRVMAGEDATLIAKVESQAGLTNLDGIIRAADAVLIDRGDLSREVPVGRLPELQRHIIAGAHRKPAPAYVATNLLDSMVAFDRPFRAEVNDIVGLLLDGANGLVLAAETAVGKYPLQCVRMVRRLIDEHERTVMRQDRDRAGRLKGQARHSGASA
jgi:pyruvate kinase